MNIEIEYIEKKIRDQLINKNFKLWDRESINFLISIFDKDNYKSLYNINLILLNDYIDWYLKNIKNNYYNMYSFNNLEYIYNLIKENTINNIESKDTYLNILENLDKEKNEKNIINNDIDCCFLYYIIDNFKNYINIDTFNFLLSTIFIIFIILFRYLILLFTKNKEKKYILEVNIPISDKLINNPITKLFNINNDSDNINNNNLSDIFLNKNKEQINNDNIKLSIEEIFKKFIGMDKIDFSNIFK